MTDRGILVRQVGPFRLHVGGFRLEPLAAAMPIATELPSLLTEGTTAVVRHRKGSGTYLLFARVAPADEPSGAGGELAHVLGRFAGASRDGCMAELDPDELRRVVDVPAAAGSAFRVRRSDAATEVYRSRLDHVSSLSCREEDWGCLADDELLLDFAWFRTACADPGRRAAESIAAAKVLETRELLEPAVARRNNRDLGAVGELPHPMGNAVSLVVSGKELPAGWRPFAHPADRPHDTIEIPLAEYGGEQLGAMLLDYTDEFGAFAALEPSLQRAVAFSVDRQLSYGPANAPIFVSYSHQNGDDVRRDLYEPLARAFGRASVFLDSRTLKGGQNWLATIADSIASCSVFVAFLDAHYFASKHCVWELQMALNRDPAGQDGLLLPVARGAVDLPPYCSLIQVHTLGDDGGASIVDRVRRALEKERA